MYLVRAPSALQDHNRKFEIISPHIEIQEHNAQCPSEVAHEAAALVQTHMEQVEAEEGAVLGLEEVCAQTTNFLLYRLKTTDSNRPRWLSTR